MKKLKKIFGKDSAFWGFPTQMNEKYKNTSLVELFFDIVVVVALGGAVHELTGSFKEITIEGHLSFSITRKVLFTLLQLVSILQIWRHFTVYSSRYENNGMRHRLLTILIMAFIILSSVSSYINPDDANAHKESFNVIFTLDIAGLMGAMMIISYFYLTIYKNTKDIYEKKSVGWKMKSTIIYVISSIVNIIIGATIAFENTKIFIVSSVIFTIGLSFLILFDYLSSTNKIFVNAKSHIHDHIKERFSILFIIFAGEMLVQIVQTTVKNIIYDNEEIGRVIGNLVGGFMFVVAMWWGFEYGMFAPNIKNRSSSMFLYTNSMINLFISIVFVTVGLIMVMDNKHVTENENIYHFGKIGKYVFAFGIFYYLISRAAISSVMMKYNKERKVLFPRGYIITGYIMRAIYTGIALLSLAVDSEVFLWITFGYISLFILSTIVWNYLYNTNIQKYKEEYLQREDKFIKQEKEWEKKRIIPYLDLDWHKKNNYKINEFSAIAKRLNEK